MVLSSPAFSIGTSRRSGDYKQGPYFVPGSGAYNPNKSQNKNAPSWRFGSSQRNGKLKDDYPGPGQYENGQNKLTKTHFPEYKFGVKPSSESQRNNIPGPGSYNPSLLGKTFPEFSFSSKGFFPEQYKNPGPGAYEVINTTNNINARPSSKIGNSKRAEEKPNEFPGPGAYDHITSSYNLAPRLKYKFGTSTRDNFNMIGNSRVPGPGSYNIKGQLENNIGNGITMISRTKDLTMNGRAQTPGPGAYDPDKKQEKVPPAYRIGSAPRSRMTGSEFCPGPGQYHPSPANRPASASYKIGTSKRSNLNGGIMTPGPGNYESKSMMGGPKFCMAKKRESKLNSETPGPGAYDPEQEWTNVKFPSHLIGTSMRSDFERKKETPGPGQYDVRKDLGGPKYPFGSAQRGEQRISEDPGPGNYDLPPKFADVPKYLLKNSQNNSLMNRS